MPVTAVQPADPASAGLPTTAAPAPGFAAALSRHVGDPRRLPTVSLGEMVASLAAGGRQPSATSAAFAPSHAALAPPMTPVASSDTGRQVLAAGERYLGVPYVWGGTNPDVGFDCSGFVQQVYADLGVSLPRVSIDQSRSGAPVADLDRARPGDLVFWHGDGTRPNHIGIYAGDGRMLVAPRSGDVVRYQELSSAPDAIRRVIG